MLLNGVWSVIIGALKNDSCVVGWCWSHALRRGRLGRVDLEDERDMCVGGRQNSTLWTC